jgi:tRNA(Ile)-lysidine synthase
MRRVASARPLLAVSRAVLETCARERGLSWIEDESNADTRFARNYLRREVMPRLSARWPRTAETMAGLARRLAEAQSLLDELASRDATALSRRVEWGTCFSLERPDCTRRRAPAQPAALAFARAWRAHAA